MRRRVAIGEEKIRSFVDEVFGDDLHVKRVLSLTHATLGVVQAASLSLAAIGRALALARGEEFSPKHGIKQVDRLLSNEGLDVWKLFELWVPHVLGQRDEARISLDWTDFDDDDQTTLVASLVTRHGRSTPLMWLTVQKSALKGNRSLTEDTILERLREIIPRSVRVTILADRGFEDVKLYALLNELGFKYVVRFRGQVLVTSAQGEARKAAGWVPEGGRSKVLKAARLTAQEVEVGAVVCVKQKGMKEAWHLATNITDQSGSQVITLYGRRFTCEETFRDVKDLRFGMGMSAIHLKSPERRDRLFLLSALAQVLLTLLGAAGEALGFDRRLKANTSKKRTHSLFFQGAFYFQWMQTMSNDNFGALVDRFGQLVREQPVLRQALGLI